MYIVCLCILFRFDTVFTNKMYLEVVGTTFRPGSLKPPMLVLHLYSPLSLAPKQLLQIRCGGKTSSPALLHDWLEDGHPVSLFI